MFIGFGVGVALPAVSESITLTMVDAAGGYGDTHVNTAILRTVSSDVTNGWQYLRWHSQSKQLRSAKRALPSGSWSVSTTGITLTNADDAHNFFSWCAASDGKLLTSGDMHGVEMNFRLGTGAGDDAVASWQTAPIVAAQDESSVTYPAFANLNNGDTVMMWRRGASGDGATVLYRYRPGVGLTLLATNLVDGEGAESFYPDQLFYNPANDRLYISGCWRETTSLNTNHDRLFFYVLSDDNWSTVRAEKVNGTAQTLPVTRANAGYIVTLATGNGLINTGSVCAFADGRPITVTYRDPGDGFAQLWLHYWDGSAWVERWVPGDEVRQQNVPFTVRGLIDTFTWSALGQASIKHKAGRTIAIGSAVAYGAGVWAYICEEPTLTQWTLRQLTNEDVGEWTCAADNAIWLAYGEIRCLVQRSQRPQTDATVIGAQDVKELIWRPQSAPYTYTAPEAIWDPNSVPGCVYAGDARVGGVVVVGTVNSNRTKCLDIRDIRDKSSRYTAAQGDAPNFIWNSFTGAVQGFSGGVLFNPATADFVLTTDATLLAALDGTNQPWTVPWVGRIESLAAASALFGFGSSNSHFFCVDVQTDGSLRVQRSSGGSTVSAQSAASAIAAATNYVITVRFDGTNVSAWVNGTLVIAPTALSSAGAMTLTGGTIGARRRTGNDLHASATWGALAIYDNATSMANRRAAESGLAIKRNITVTHDTAAPTLSSAIVPSAGTTLALTYNKTLDPASVPAAGDYSLAGTSAAVASVAIAGAVVTLTLSGNILSGETVTVSYTVPGSGMARSATEHVNAATLSSQAVTNNSTATTAPTFVGYATDTDVSSATRTVDLSGIGLATNDILLMTVQSRIGGTVSVTLPSGEGWTLIAESERIVAGALEATYWKRWGAGSTDDTTPTFTLSTSGLSWAVLCSVWRGCKTSGNPYTVTPVRVDHAANNTLTAGLLGAAPGASSRTVWIFQSTDDNTLNANTRGTLHASFNCANASACIAVVSEAGVDSSANACSVTESTLGPDTARILTLALASP